MLWRFHHLVADAAAVAITIYHWLQAYEALTAGTSQELAPGSSYLKTIAADAAYLDSSAYQKDLAHWTERFDPIPPPLIADLEVRPANKRTYPSRSGPSRAKTSENLQEHYQSRRVNVQRVLIRLFSCALGRRYSQTDIVIGVALHRRDLTNRLTVGMMAGVIAVR